MRVRLAPAELSYGIVLDVRDGVAELVLDGLIKAEAEESLKSHLTKVVAAQPRQLVLRMEGVRALSQAGARALAFTCEDLGLDTDLYMVGASDEIQATLRGIGFIEEVTLVADRSQIGAPAPTGGRT